ncbi:MULTISPECIES: DUF2264 domain-containing protein [Arthrobacter]|uniref:DUF2264 domain-containing protein n=2 Tax=Arthrobacter TaxID=1663 RepID=A0ABU9KMK5_9MICC|nr:DUF2264 domain-containing protein [Arthrobacter sp. YJM1]MDP5227952.1 DUF2264 domain-containing protein [Arthrobacter sp. YJM1]
MNDDAAQRRAYWTGFADRQLLALRPHFSPHHALVHLSGRPSISGVRSDELEGFARTFLLAALRVAGTGGEDPHGHLDWYRSGLVAGAARDGAESWNPVAGRTQALVEAASVAIALQLSKPWLWDRMSRNEQDVVAAWLQGSSTAEAWDNNWVLFSVHVAEFLAGAGYPHNPEHVTAGLDRIEDWYAGEGWYRDGDNDGTGDFFDYYCGWALHLYPLLWCRFAGQRAEPHPWAAERLPRYRERLAEFLRHYPEFFGDDGAPLFQGRSLTYRYAAVAPLALGALFLGEELSPAELASFGTVATRALEYFDTADAYPDGIATLGWHGPYEPMVQEYSGPGSPYWSSKAFLALLIPEDSPFWQPVAPAPGETATTLSAPGFLLHRGPDGIAQLANHGSDKHYGPAPDNDLYSRLAYSSATGPLTATGAEAGQAVDNHLALIRPDGTASWRSRIHRLPASDGTLASFHRPVFSATEDEAEQPVTVATGTTARGGYQLRVHRITVPEGWDADGVTVRDGGWAAAGGVQSTLWPLNTEDLSSGDLNTEHLSSGDRRADAAPAVVVREVQGSTAFGDARCPVAESTLDGPVTLRASVHHLGREALTHRPGEATLREHDGRVWARVRMEPVGEGEPFVLALDFRTP